MRWRFPLDFALFVDGVRDARDSSFMDGGRGMLVGDRERIIGPGASLDGGMEDSMDGDEMLRLVLLLPGCEAGPGSVTLGDAEMTAASEFARSERSSRMVGGAWEGREGGEGERPWYRNGESWNDGEGMENW